ncbi:MAG: amidohydrolase [Gemmatimonadaceae bacterium]|nr:amidohydrolase [Gemmatimonadaceae bacterium]
MAVVRARRITLALTLAICGGRGALAQVGAATTIYTGTFITLDSLGSRAHAIGVRRGTIVAVGSAAHVDSAVGPNTKHVAIPGFVLPGFVDAHAHPLFLGQQLETMDLHALSKAEVIRRVSVAASKAPAGAWIRGSGWDQAFWTPPDFPTATELDRVSAGHPVILDRVDGHAVWVNGRALELAHIEAHRADPSGGRIMRDATGAPSGIFLDSAMSLVTRAMPKESAATIERQLRAALAHYSAWGLTGVHDAQADLPVLRVWKSLAARGELPTRMYVMAASQSPTLTRTLGEGMRVGTVSDLLTIRSVKVVLDGALGSRGAELRDPYADEPGKRGLVLVSDAELDSIIKLCIARGFQVNVHAIGDAANRRLLDAFARAEPATRTLRFRDEHASLVSDDQLPRFKELGVIASIQPVFVGEYSRFAEARVGAQRVHWVERTRDFVESGARIASGTDYPASDTGDPIATLFSMVTRRGADGTPKEGWLPDQRVSVDVALRSMTAGPAYAAFEENRLGAITVGRIADFTVLSGDPYATAPDSLINLRVIRTIVAGKTVWKRKPSASR